MKGMSLPSGFLDELRSRLSLSQVVGRKVMWDRKKSNQGKGDMWAPCPFHHEKTASFHVDDRKGFYYCFGCHVKGDAISFVRETENVGFMEAIQMLASEAGMVMPERDPQAQEKSDKRAILFEVMEKAVRFFRMSLGTSAGAQARAYLEKRGLDPNTLNRFEIGFAPNDNAALRTALEGQGVTLEQLIETGMSATSDDGRPPYDRFRNRIMFPIRDGRGRCIAFGGRAMDPNARAKYLNSPETILFDKGRNLYNLGPARAAVGKDHSLIVAEGYMDVIALSQGGFEGAVAPLGTAVTEDQLHLMWRIAPEPIIALDGDKAGIRAAHRVIDLALPHLRSGQALRFAMMPAGQDPDDLLRSGGPEAVKQVLEAAQPMVQLMWAREIEGQTFDSPERKAALDKRLFEKTSQIQDAVLRGHYEAALKDLKWQHFRARPKGAPWSPKARVPVQSTTKASELVAADENVTNYIRESVLLAVLIHTPPLLNEFADQLFMLDLETPELDQMLRVMRNMGDETTTTIRSEISRLMGVEPLEKLMRSRHVSITPCLRVPDNIEMARMTVQEELAKIGSNKGLAVELNEAISEQDRIIDDTILWRLGQAADAKNRASRSDNEDRAQYDLGDNGARINREEREKLDALLSKINYGKKGNS